MFLEMPIWRMEFRNYARVTQMAASEVVKKVKKKSELSFFFQKNLSKSANQRFDQNPVCARERSAGGKVN